MKAPVPHGWLSTNRWRCVYVWISRISTYICDMNMIFLGQWHSQSWISGCISIPNILGSNFGWLVGSMAGQFLHRNLQSKNESSSIKVAWHLWSYENWHFQIDMQLCLCFLSKSSSNITVPTVYRILKKRFRDSEPQLPWFFVVFQDDGPKLANISCYVKFIIISLTVT